MVCSIVIVMEEFRGLYIFICIYMFVEIRNGKVLCCVVLCDLDGSAF